MESTLATTFTELQAEIGSFLGFQRGPVYGDPAWTTPQQNQITSCLKDALRMFYWPEPLDGMTASHDWSFMHPTASLDLPAGATTIPLPDDYGGFEGPLTVLTTKTTTAQPWRINWRNEGELRQMYATTPNRTGPPMYAAEVPIKLTTPTEGQRKQLFLFPSADMEYTLQVQYYFLPNYLTGDLPYVYGGAQHAGTVLAAGRAAAENLVDDTLGEMGPKRQEFKRRLAASISMDRRNKPQQLSANVDRSDNYGGPYNPHWYPSGLVSYNGIPID